MLSQMRGCSERLAVPAVAIEAPGSHNPPRREIQPSDPIESITSEDRDLAISAAIAAYLGVKPHIRQIRLIANHPWGNKAA